MYPLLGSKTSLPLKINISLKNVALSFFYYVTVTSSQFISDGLRSFRHGQTMDCHFITGKPWTVITSRANHGLSLLHGQTMNCHSVTGKPWNVIPLQVDHGLSARHEQTMDCRLITDGPWTLSSSRTDHELSVHHEQTMDC